MLDGLINIRLDKTRQQDASSDEFYGCLVLIFEMGRDVPDTTHGSG